MSWIIIFACMTCSSGLASKKKGTAGFPTGLDMAIAATKLLRELGGSAEPCRHLMSCEGQRLIPD